MDRVLKYVLVVLLMANLLLQAFSLVELHQLHRSSQISLSELTSQQNEPRYFCGNYYLYRSQNPDRVQVSEDGVVLNLWNSEDNVCNGGIYIPDYDTE